MAKEKAQSIWSNSSLKEHGLCWAGGNNEDGSGAYGVYPLEVNIRALGKMLERIGRISYAFPRELSILDLGSGNGYKSLPIIDQLRASGGIISAVEAVDLNEKALETYGSFATLLDIPITTRNSDLLETQVEPGKFNVVWLFEIIHWLNEKQAYDLFHKLKQLLPPNGIVMTSACTPFNVAHLGNTEEHWKRYGDAKHAMREKRPLKARNETYGREMTFWSEASVGQLLKKTGLTLLDTSYAKNQMIPSGRGPYFMENIYFSAINI